jgi:hypothetical protein
MQPQLSYQDNQHQHLTPAGTGRNQKILADRSFQFREINLVIIYYKISNEKSINFLGKSKERAYSNRLKFHDNPVCKVCKSKEETLEHIILRSNSAGLLRTKLRMMLNLNIQ